MDGLIFGVAYARREVWFQNRLGYFIVGRKLTVFALFYFVSEGNFPSTSPRGSIFRGAISRRVFCVTSLGGGGAYTWRINSFLKSYSSLIGD